MMSRFLILSILLPMLAHHDLQAQEVAVRSDRSSILIGEQVELTLSAQFNPSLHRVQFPILPDTFDRFEIIERRKRDTMQKGSNIRISERYRITRYDSGIGQIAALPFELISLQGDTPRILLSQAICIQVQTVAVDTAKPFKPIMAIRPVRLPLTRIIIYALAALLVFGLVIWGFVTYLRKRKAKPVEMPAAPLLLPHVKALQALAETEAAGLWEQGEVKAYYTAISDTLRVYLEEQFHLDCLDKTSAEIIQQVKRQRILNPYRQPLRELMQLADLVKFAKVHPSPDEHRQALNTAREVIQDSHKAFQSKQATEEVSKKA